MKTKKKLIAFGMSFLVLCGAITSAYAINVVDGNKYQLVLHFNIPGGGGESFNTYWGSKKVTTGKFATFKKTRADAALGNFAELITSTKVPKSEAVGIPLNKVILAQEYSCSKGTVYYTGVISSYIEPSNSCGVTLEFSADNLK